MKTNCEVIRDLLPLYADDACSEKSRELVEEHLQECAECGTLLQRLKKTEIEAGLQQEKDSVLEYGERRFRRRTATAGLVAAGVLMIPILVCLIVNLATGHALDWFFIVLAALCVVASLVIVPLMAPEDKLFRTFCAFCASLMILLAVICLVTGGSWFWIVSSATLFGLGVIFLPFVVRARPVRQLIGDSKRWLIVLVTDAVLFSNMMNMIFSRGGIKGSNILIAVGVIAGIGLVILEIMRKRGNQK